MKTQFLAVMALASLWSAAHAAERKPVLLVVANHHFYYKEYSETRRGLEEAGYTVEIGAGHKRACNPHRGTGEGADGGILNPDVALADVDASKYSAIAFAGGWGASQYQPNFPGRYTQPEYNGTKEVKAASDKLIGEFLQQKKVVGGLCHGVTVLAWARVDGKSPIEGRTVVAYSGGGPGYVVSGQYFKDNDTPSRAHIERNGGTASPSASIGNPRTTADDVYVDGPIVTGENQESAYLFGQTLAKEIAKTK